MIEDNIENIRRNAILKIKEKIKKLKLENRIYIHPCCKEFQEDMKILGFDSGNRYIVWMQQNGILKSPTDVKQKENEYYFKKANCNNQKEYRDKLANDKGFKDWNERRKIGRWNDGTNFPMSENPYCAKWFGEFIAENYVMKTFIDPIKAPSNNPGFDWTCNKGEKVQHKARCLEKTNTSIGWGFPIRRNHIPDYFILSGWKDRESLEPIFILIFHRDEIIRGAPFWMRPSFWITNKPEYLREFDRYEIKDKLEKLKEYIKGFKKENDIY